MDGVTDLTLFIILALFAIQFILANIALVKLLRATNGKKPKILWHIIILVLFIIGPIAYIIVETRKNKDNE